MHLVLFAMTGQFNEAVIDWLESTYLWICLHVFVCTKYFKIHRCM